MNFVCDSSWWLEQESSCMADWLYYGGWVRGTNNETKYEEAGQYAHKFCIIRLHIFVVVSPYLIFHYALALESQAVTILYRPSNLHTA